MHKETINLPVVYVNDYMNDEIQSRSNEIASQFARPKLEIGTRALHSEIKIAARKMAETPISSVEITSTARAARFAIAFNKCNALRARPFAIEPIGPTSASTSSKTRCPPWNGWLPKLIWPSICWTTSCPNYRHQACRVRKSLTLPKRRHLSNPTRSTNSPTRPICTRPLPPPSHRLRASIRSAV